MKPDNKPFGHGLFLLLPVLVGFGLFFFTLLFLDLAANKTRFDELALGKEVKSYPATYNGVPVHCFGISDGEECIKGWKQRGGYPLTLWLGNSQLHAINQMKPGDVNCVRLLFDKLVADGYELLAFSEPNASLQEHYLLFEYLKNRLGGQLRVPTDGL